MVVIRLSRGGSKKRPFYRFTVAESHRARDGAFIEKLGFFNPGAKGREETIRVALDRIDFWVSQGAQMSPRVKKLVKGYRKSSVAGSESDQDAA